MTEFIMIAAFLSSISIAQDVPPPPKPTEDGPSLEVTMKFIQDKLNQEGPVRWANVFNDGSIEIWGSEISGAIAETKSCELMFRQSTYRAAAANNCFLEDYKASFRDVKRLTGLPLSLSPSKYSNVDRQQTTAVTIEIDLTQKSDTPIAPSDPPGKKKKKKKPVGGTTTVRKVVDPRTLFLSLNNEEMAHRVAKAITHAVELCGGGEKPEPS